MLPWVGSEKMPRGKERVRRASGNDRQIERHKQDNLYLSFSLSFQNLHTPVLHLNSTFLYFSSYWPLDQKFGLRLGQICANSILWLRVPTVRDISSLSTVHAATRLPCCHFREDLQPSNPFNAAPAVNVDWFSPTVGAQWSPSVLHLLALCADYEKVRRRRFTEAGGNVSKHSSGMLH